MKVISRNLISELVNLPIGSMISRWGGSALSVPANMNDFVTNNYDFIPLNPSNPVYRSDIYNKIIGANSSVTTNRTAITKNSSNWSLFIDNANILQTSSNGSSFTNYDYSNINITGNAYSSNTYCSNFSNNKTVITNTGYSYVYSTDGTNFTFVKSPIVSSSHINIVRPYVSGSTYSFFDVTNSKRVYTTDHTNFSDVTGFGTSDLQIHKMNNGHLYTTTGTTLRVSTNDGVTWTSYTLPASINNSNNHCLDFDGTTYVFGTTSNALYSSTDLSAWTSRTSGISATPNLTRVYFRNALWFVFSATNGTTTFSTSSNGTAWTNRTWGSSRSTVGSSVIYVNSLYMIIGNITIQTSSDGVTWTESIVIAGGTQADSDQRSVYGTGRDALIVASNTAYFYNAGSWTTITSSQQNTDIMQVPLSSQNGVLVKGK